MRDDINVVLFSDHGMTDLQWMEKVIELDIYIDMTHIIQMMDRGPVVSLWPKQDKFEEVSSACICSLCICMFFMRPMFTVRPQLQKQASLFSICYFEEKIDLMWKGSGVLWPAVGPFRFKL